MEEQIEAILKFHMPRWNELPDIDLYLDQVVNYIEKYLSAYFIDKEDKVITKTMINNYVKQGVMPAPEKKNIRKLIVNKFIIIYKVDNINEKVYILHIFSEKKDYYNLL